MDMAQVYPHNYVERVHYETTGTNSHGWPQVAKEEILTHACQASAQIGTCLDDNR